jgi:hypothetical protein
MLLSRRGLFIASVTPTLRPTPVIRPILTRPIEIDEDQFRVLQHISTLNKLIADQMENPLSISRTEDYMLHMMSAYNILIRDIDNPDLQKILNQGEETNYNPCIDVLCA